MTRNRIGEENQPYRLQHAENGALAGWNDDALDEAKRQDKQILLR